MRIARPLVVAKYLPAPRFSRLKLYAAVLAASHWMASGHTWAAPEGGEVVGGNGVIQQAGAETIITQATERMAIDWRSFDVAANERVEFIQPSSSAVALNRVLSNRGSEILGRIDANGQVILVNPHGVVFGKDAVVNVGGMIASGLNIDPDSFINGDFALNSIEGADSKVINYGIINAATGGSVTLVGKQVQNDGLISAKLGAVNLVAGNAAVLTFDPSGMVGVMVTEAVVQDELGVDAAVINNGEILAEGGRVLLSASVSEDVFSNAVNNAGMNKSSSVVVHEDGSFTLGAGADLVNTGTINTSVNEGAAGQVVLLGNNITHSGSINANSAGGTGGSIELHSTDTTQLTGNASLSAQATTVGEGGDIKVLGNKVGLVGQAGVDASGAQGGGQVLIGGDKTGSNPQIRNADFIYLGDDTSVKTDALIDGNGGKLITFASDTARIYGNLHSRGGSFGGNGGFIETSGLKGFEILKTPDITAPAGTGGTWLIDPSDITIQGTGSITDSGSTNNPFFTSSDTRTTLSVDTLKGALTNGALVEVITGAGSGGTGAGNITLANDLIFNFNGTATLRLLAHNNIELNGKIERQNTNVNGALNIELIANSDNSGGGNISGGDISIKENTKVVTNGGYFYAGVRKANDADGFLDSDINNPTLGTFTSTNALIDTSGNQEAAGDDGVVTGYTGGGGDIVINANGDVKLGELLFRVKAGNADTYRRLTQVGSVTVLSGANVTLGGRINFNDTGKRTTNGLKGYQGNLLDSEDTNLTVSAKGNININAAIADGFNDNGAPAVVNHGGDDRDALNISLTADGDIDIDANIYTGGGNFSAKGANVYSDGFIINTDRANPSLTNDGDYNGDAEWSNGGNVSIEAHDTIKLGDVVTDASCATPTTTACTGNLSLAGIDTDLDLAGMQSTVNIAQALLKVAGTTTINIGQGNALLNNSNNTFAKTINIQSAHDVTLSDSDANGISLGNVSVANNLTLNSSGDISQTGVMTIGGATDLTATGKNILLNNTGNNFGGEVTASAGSLVLVDTNDLSIASITMSGGSTGIVSLSSGSGDKIILNGDITSTTGTENSISLNSDVEIANNLEIDSGTGAINFNGAVDSEIANANNLTLFGGDITLIENAGANGKLGIFSIGSSGDVTFADMIAGSFNLTSANSVTGGTITTAGADSSTGDGGAGGAVTITAGSVTLDTVNTSGGNATGAGTSVGGNAGAITLTANGVSGNKFITVENDLIATAGQGSNGGTNGTVGSVNLNLTNTVVAGNVNLNANSFLSSSINVSGLGADDTFNLTDTNNTWELSNTNAGTVKHSDNLLNSPVITFTGFENITGGSGVDIFDITHNISNSINGGGNADTFKINVASLDASVNGGSGADDFYINVATTKANLYGDGGNDVFTVNNTGIVIASIDGGTNTDTIYSANRDNIWLLGTSESLNTALLFSQIENVEGNDGKDSFHFSGARAVSGTINAAGHNEDEVFVTSDAIIDYTGSDFLLQGVSNAEHLRSENGGTLSVASDSGDTINWSFDNAASVTNGVNAVEILGFTSFAGGNGNDFFAVGDYTFATLLTGGAGTDTFSLLSNSASPYSIVVDDDFNVGSNATLNGLEVIDATNNLNTSLQVLLGTTTNWTVTGQNNGNVVNAEIGSVQFVNVANLVGGAGTDNFVFDITGAVTGSIDGAGGNDSVTARNSDSTWSILGENTGNISTTETTPENYLASFINVENLQGSSANDTFTFSDGASVVSARGNGGVDTADLSAITSDITVTIGAATSYGFNGVERVVANSERNFTLAASAGTNTWTISDFDGAGDVSDGINDGTVGGMQFVDFKNLEGGTGVDTFNLQTNFTGSINGLDGNDIFNIQTAVSGSLFGDNGADRFVFFDGGSLATAADGGTDTGVDQVDMTNITTDVTVQLNGSIVNNVNNVERVIANSLRNFTLAGTGSNTWTISDFDGSGNVSDGINDGAVAGIQFVDFKNLQGGAGVDTFNLQTNFTGNILGLGGNDIFNIYTSLAGGLFGGGGADSFVFYDGGSLIAAADGGTDAAVDQVDMTNITSDVTVTLNGSIVNNVNNVERVIANSQRNFTLAASVGNNTWVISDFDGAGNVSDGANDGTVAGIQFVDFKNLRGGTGADVFQLITDFTGAILGLDGDDIFNIRTTVTGSLSGGDGADSFVFFNGGSLSTVANGGNDTAIDQVNMTNITDDVTVTLNGSTVNNVNNIERVIANSQRSFTLAASAGNNTWTIFDFDGVDSVSDGINDGTVGGMQFVDFRNLHGGTGADTFNLQTNFTGDILGLGGKDIFNIRTAITGLLSGGDGADSFVFFDGGSLSQVADGGSDSAIDQVNLTNITSDITVTLNGSTINNVNNVERVIANSQRNFTLAAISGSNVWTISDFDNTGNVSDGVNDGTVAGIQFVDFGTLIGGSDADTFIVEQSGSIGSLNGGLGNNSLVGRNSANTWRVTGTNNGILSVTNGAAYVSSFNNIQNLAGGTGVDIFELNALISTSVNGGQGNDQFLVNATSNNLLGDAGNDHFVFSSVNNAGAAASIDGGEGDNTITGRDITNTWTISNTNEGAVSITDGAAYISSFTNIQSLVGGTFADIFEINANITSSIQAGDGNNIFRINTHVTELQGGVNDDQFIFGLSGRADSIIGGVGINSLYARNEDNTWTISSPNSGSIQTSASVLYVDNFSGIQILNGGSSADAFIINASAENIFGNAGNDTFSFSNGGSANVINGGTGVNTLNGRNQNNSWIMSSANTGAVSAGNIYVGSFQNIGVLGGGSASDTLIAFNQANKWDVNNTDAGVLSSAATPSLNVSFTGMENLRGSEGVDQFVFSMNGNLSGLLDGGSTPTMNSVQDTLNLSAINGALTVELGNQATSALNVVNVEVITAAASNPDNHVLKGASDTPYLWKITSQNQGVIERVTNPLLETSVSFVNFGDLQGGTNSDRFIVQGNVKSINGGDGVDFIDYSQRAENFIVVLGGSGGFGITGIDGIEGVVGNSGLGGGYTSSIQVGSGNNIWEIGTTSNFSDGINDGSVTINNTKITFENFTNLSSGSGEDIFNYTENGQWIGTIDGGEGNNVVNALVSSRNQQFFVNGSGTNSGTTLKNIDQLTANNNTNSILISDLQANSWVIDSAGNGRLNNSLNFINFSSLIGGTFNDTFNVSDISSLKGMIDGGAGNGNDTINLNNINKSIQVAVNATTEADINLINFETLNANNSFANTLKGDSVNNEWYVNGLNSGRLNDAISFTGFSNLSGGDMADRVVFNTNQANITGHIDLGAGQDTLDLSNSNRGMLVQINSAKNSAINGALSISNIETVNGDATQTNRLVGDNFANTWTLNDINSGQISSAQTGVVSFTNFNNLTGGSIDDYFVFEAVGSVSGLVDGGLHSVRDVVDLSASNSSNVLIAGSGQSVGFANIEKYIGNNVDSIFSAANTANSWSLTGANRGILNGSVEFESFAFINGGNAVDDFIINNAIFSGAINGRDGDDRFDVQSSTIPGKISGGNGNDRFIYQVASGVPGVSEVDGGNGENRLTVTGGGEKYNINHYAGHLEYEDGTGNNQSILYSNMSNIFDNVVANSLSISGTSAADTFHMLAGRYTVNNSTIVNFDNKPSLFVNGGTGDQVIVDGTVAADSTIAFNNLQISAVNAGKIQARTLELVNTGRVGSADARLNTAITELSLNTTNGAIYLEEQDALILKDLNTSMTDLIDLKIGGDLSAANSLSYSGNFNLQSVRGNINLGNNNALTGMLNMDAAGHIALGNLQSLNLNNLTAQSVNINSVANIKGAGLFSVAGLAVLEAGGQISLLNSGNDVNQLRIKNAVSVEVFDKTGFTTADLQVADRIDLRSSGAIVLGSSCGVSCNDSIGITTKNLTVQSDSIVTVAKPINAVDAVNITSNSIVVNNSLTSASISLDAAGTLLLNDGGNLLGQGDSIISLNAGNIEQHSIVRSNGNLDVIATGNIVMSESAVMESLNGDVNLSSNDLQLAMINANNGSIVTDARGVIKDGNGNATNITAKRWQADANNGIGSGFGKDADAIETQIEVLSARNAGQLTGSSSIAITNSDTLIVEQLRNNGNITLTNKNGDVILDNSTNDDFNLANLDARTQGGVINAGLNGGHLLLSLSNGMVRAENKANKKNPDIIADTATFTIAHPFDFGERNRKIVMHIPETYNQDSRLSFVVWHLGRPLIMNDLSKVPNDSVISGRDQLIQIEGLSEIDPAIFTSIKNYVHDEVAILLPSDQRFDEEDL